MCGIVGLLRHRGMVTGEDEARVRACMECMAHRGPDQEGAQTVDGNVVLGHKRLSLIDLSLAGVQPMSDRTGRYTIVYNGEVYNFRELGAALSRETGVAFASASDTEVILHHLIRHADDPSRALREWEGMFAFALYDSRERTLLLARDRFGIKPLYYAAGPDAFWFASEMKALLGTVAGRVDSFSLFHFLETRLDDFIRYTMIEGIRQLEPGGWMRVHAGGRVDRGTWFQLGEFIDESLYRRYERAPFDEVVEEFGGLFEEGVRSTMISDAPLAAMNSGGVDSSLVSAVARRMNPRIALYHVDVAGARTSELRYARATASHLGGELRVVEMDDAAWRRAVVHTVYHQEVPPTYHPNSVPFVILCERIHADGVKGVLTGEGADEVFLGYAPLVLHPYLAAMRRAAGPAAPLLGSIPGLGPHLRDQEEPTLGTQLRSRGRFAGEDLGAGRFAFMRSSRERAYYEREMVYLRYHLASVLHRNDRMGMAHGIESRFPFLHTPLVRFGLNLPVKHRIRLEPRVVNRIHPFLTDKAPVRHYAARHLPREIAFRSKRGFPIGQQRRVRFGVDFLRGGFVQGQFQMDGPRLESFIRELGGADWGTVFFLEIWGRLFVLRQPPGEVERHVAASSALDRPPAPPSVYP